MSSTAFGNSAESTASQSFGFSQESKPATTSSTTGAAVAPFVFGSGASSSSAASSGFTFGATATSSSTGTFKQVLLFLLLGHKIGKWSWEIVFHGERVGKTYGKKRSSDYLHSTTYKQY